MTDNQVPGGTRRRCRRSRRWLAIASVLVIAFFGAVTALVFIWPDLPRVPTRVDAIIELGGPGVKGRDRVAVELARAHRAPFLVQSTVVAEAGTDRCLPPVSDVTVLCFHATPNTTRREAEYIGKQAKPGTGRRSFWSPLPIKLGAPGCGSADAWAAKSMSRPHRYPRSTGSGRSPTSGPPRQKRSPSSARASGPPHIPRPARMSLRTRPFAPIAGRGSLYLDRLLGT